MKKKRTIVLFVNLVCLFFLGAVGCNPIPIVPSTEEKHPPVPRAWTPDQVDALVSMEQVSIYSQAPRENGTPPAECDYIRFLRFKLREAPQDPSAADAILLMIPGVVEGANGFEYIGRQTVYMAKTQYGKSFEVWAFDRRNNCLEDVTGAEAAEQETDLKKAEEIFINYYYKGVPLNGRTFKGFLKSADVPFVSEFGLKMDTEDIYRIITTMIPDPEVRRSKVFVGGHSMGGIHTSMFAGWDFDGSPATIDDAGYRNCAGLFALDSTVVPSTEVIKPFLDSLPQWLKDLGINITEDIYRDAITLIRDGTLPRVVPILDGEVGALMEMVGFLAHKAPDQEHTAIRNIPYSDNVDMLNRYFHSRTLERFLDGTDDIKNFRFTNEALFGILFDDDFAPLGMIQTSLGFLNGGEVVKKDFPNSSDLEQIPILYDLLSGFTGKQQLYIAAQSGCSAPLYTWANFDEIGTAEDTNYQSTDGSITYTTIKDEVSDIQDFARAQYIGPSNLIEWYFSTRRIIDIMAATLPYGPGYGLNFIHADKLAGLPQMEFHAGDSFIGEMPGSTPGKYPLMEGYNHMDPMFAAVDRPGFKESQVIRPLIEFALANAGE
jgi:pimeloyl-ACP methyl ester carboxylesterase